MKQKKKAASVFLIIVTVLAAVLVMLVVNLVIQTDHEEMQESEKAAVVEDNDCSGEIKVYCFDAEPVFKELNLIDNHDLTVSLSCEDTDPADGYTCMLTAVNHTEDDVMITIGETALNDWMIPASVRELLGEPVAAGESRISRVEWAADAIRDRYIQKIGSLALELYAYVRNNENTAEKLTAGGIYEVKMNGAADGAKEPDTVMWDVLHTDAYIFDVMRFACDEQGYPLWQAWIENRTQSMKIFTLDEAVLDGVSVDPAWSCKVFPEKKTVTDISWWTMNMEPSNTPMPQDVQFSLQASAMQYDGTRQSADVIPCVYYPQAETVVPPGSVHEKESEGMCLCSTDQAQLYLADIEFSSVEGYYILDLKMKNSSMKKLRFSVDRVYIMNYELYPQWQENVPSYAEKSSALSLDLTEHKEVFTQRIQEMDLHLTICDEDGEILADNLCRINPIKNMLIETVSLLESVTDEEESASAEMTEGF